MAHVVQYYEQSNIQNSLVATQEYFVKFLSSVRTVCRYRIWWGSFVMPAKALNELRRCNCCYLRQRRPVDSF